MPFALTLVGMLLVITGFQNTYKEFGAQVTKDFTGDGNFFYWILSIGIIGSLGYAKGLEGFSRAFMALILIVLVISLYKTNPGFFSSLQSQVSAGSNTATNPIGTPLSTNSAQSAGGSSGGGISLSNIGQDVSLAATVASFF